MKNNRIAKSGRKRSHQDQPQADLIDVQIEQDESVPWVLLTLALGVDLLAVAVVMMGRGGSLPYATAGALHLVATGMLLMGDHLHGSRRTLALCLVLCMPPFGALLAAIALGTQRRAQLADLAPDDSEESPALDPDHVQRVAAGLPACEALLASGGEDRQAILSALTRRGDADAVALLRWLTSTSQELAVETALALEELSVGFESDLEGHRDAVADGPSYATAMRAGTFIGRAIASGIVDPVMIPVLADEARRYFALARDLDSRGWLDATMGLARLEMAAMRPKAALEVLNQALADIDEDAAPRELTALREEARFASHELLSHEPFPGTQLIGVHIAPIEVSLDGR